MTNCETCPDAIIEFGPLPIYHATRLGLSGVVLENAVHAGRCPECEKLVEVTIPNLPGLITAVALARIKIPVKLDGEAIRFLRRAVDWSAKDLAEKLDMNPSTVSRWETDKEPIGPTSEKLFRVFIGNRLKDMVPTITFDPRDIESMEISPLRSADTTLRITMRLVNEDIVDDEEPHEPRLWAVG